VNFKGVLFGDVQDFREFFASRWLVAEANGLVLPSNTIRFSKGPLQSYSIVAPVQEWMRRDR
jgi:hypothetical protein